MKSIKSKNAQKEACTGWLLIAPALVFMITFTVFPVFRSVYLSLCKYKLGMAAPEFIGLENYIKLFSNKLFWKVMGNTIYFALITIIPSMVAGLGLAVLVNRKGRHIGFVRTAYFYPVVMPMIAIASIWMFIYMAKNGLFDQLLMTFGFEPMNVLSDKEKVLPAMAVMYVWKEAGYMMVFFLSGLKAISPEVLEAAKIDGATGLKRELYVTIPLVKPTIKTVTTMAATSGFLLYNEVFFLTNGAAGTKSISFIIRELAITSSRTQYARANTIGAVQIVIGLILVGVINVVFAESKESQRGGKA